MSDLLGTAGASAVAFVATNVDDLVMTTALFAVAAGPGPLRGRHVVLGQTLGLGTLVAAAAVVAAGLRVVPDDVLGLLGLVPLALGILGLSAALRGTEDSAPPAPPVVAGALGVAGLTVSAGGDNIAVYVPFLAGQGPSGALVVLVVFALLLALLLSVARAASRRPTVARLTARWGHVVVPVALVVLGLAILGESGLLGRALDGVVG